MIKTVKIMSLIFFIALSAGCGANGEIGTGADVEPAVMTLDQFNYLAAARPILCLAPEPNVAAELVRESRSGVVAPPDDPAAIADALVALWRGWKDGRVLPERRPEIVARYEADVQAKAYAQLLEELGDR